MVAYSFQPMFIGPIRSGLGIDITGQHSPKRQTIRYDGLKRQARPGEVLQLYCRQRSKLGFKIGDARCVSVGSIRILFDEKRGGLVWPPGRTQALSDRQREIFAHSDGFASWRAMSDFWAAHHPRVVDFKGILIKWEPLA